MQQREISSYTRPSFAALFTPKLITVLREGYGAAELRRDAIAGLTVAIVALPLSMAIAIASGATPAQGLYTAIVGGFLVSALGGSRFQIGGPAGAFIILVAATAAQHGMSGVILATFLSGLMLAALGALRLGSFIKFIPFPITVGFTAGIAVIIFASQIKPLLGLHLVHEPGPLLQKLQALWAARGTISPSAAAVAAGTILAIIAMRRWQPRWPAMLMAVTAAAIACAAFNLPIATISSQFGGIPSGLPKPHLPEFSLEKLQQVFPAAVSFTLLGAIESLLSAVVADGMTGRQHRSNCELVAQGVANMGAAVFGGFCVTGTIARTATNVRAGAHGPVAGVLHALFILLFMVFAAPLAGYIPLAALAGVLAVVAWNMVESHAIGVLLRSGWGEAVVLAATFLLTIFRDLTEAIVVGLALGSVLFIHRMSRTTAVTKLAPPPASEAGQDSHPLDPSDSEIVVYRIKGPLFFGASATIGSVLDNIHDTHRALVIDFSAVPFLDASGAHMIAGLAQKAQRRGTALWLAGTSTEMRATLYTHELRPPLAQHAPTIEAALDHIHHSAT